MPIEAFVDESERNDYVLCAVVVDPRHLRRLRTDIRSLRLAGERRIHFAKENDPRRRKLLADFRRQSVGGHVFVGRSHVDQIRSLLLTSLVEHLVAADPVVRLVIESRAERDRSDLETLITLHKAGRLPEGFVYEHVRPHEEPILWAADGIAWAYGAGSEWRRNVDPLVAFEERIEP